MLPRIEKTTKYILLFQNMCPIKTYNKRHSLGSSPSGHVNKIIEIIEK